MTQPSQEMTQLGSGVTQTGWLASSLDPGLFLRVTPMTRMTQLPDHFG
jgi:hypothetical protein